MASKFLCQGQTNLHHHAKLQQEDLEQKKREIIEQQEKGIVIFPQYFNATS